jgi:hypothetical protein
MNEIGDEELHARFADLRDDDRAHAPEFRALWERAELRARISEPSRAVRVAAILAAAGIVLTAGMLFQRSRDLATRGGISPVTISDWRSPTAGLLRTPAMELLAPPAIFSSILDGATRATVQPQGD